MRQIASALAAALLFSLASCGRDIEFDEVTDTPPTWYKSCRYEWPLPGLPSSGSPVYRCYLTGEGGCKTTDVCAAVPAGFPCPYTRNECVLCPNDLPLSQC